MNDHARLDDLLADAHALCADPRFTQLLQAHWPALFARSPGERRPLSTRVHAQDQMLLHSLRHHLDAGAAVAQYFNVALQQYHAARQVMDALFSPAAGCVEVLDFACGFGRLLRFLSCCERELEITASEIQTDALAFVGTEFGVRTCPSSMQPEAFEPGRRFDFIWVASLFSHLPAPLFERWLRRLQALLTPRGVLCFSVHDQALMPPGAVMPAAGLLFQPHSENAELDAEAYGTTYVAESFVRAAIERAGDAGRPVHRIRKGLAHEQDIYVVAAEAGRDLAALGGFRRGPWGWCDERRVDGRTLRLRGWAASIDDGALAAVSIRIDGREHRCPTGRERDDVRTAFADERLATAGWSFELDLPEEAPHLWVEVTAHSERGEAALLYAGLPGGRAPAAPAAPHVYRREIDMGLRSSLSVLAALVAPGSRVLDLGTGNGALGRQLRDARGCRMDGVTLSSAERDAARDAYERIEVLDLEDGSWTQRFEAGAYDYIVCADVLEHLRHPEAVLKACHRLLRRDGWLLASIPNVAYAGMVLELMHGDWRYGREGLLDHTHLRFFTRRSFTRLLAAEGWAVERVEPIELSWYYTEFWTPFDRLPPPVARYLLAQPDASAYQLVFAARPAGAVAAVPDVAVPASDVSVAVAVFATTLFIDSGPQGGPVRAVHALGRVGAETQTLEFPIAAETPLDARLTWRLADRPGFLRLQALTLRDRHGKACWTWRAAADGDLPLRGAARQQLEFGALPVPPVHVPVLLLGSEAQLELPIAAGLQGGDGGPWRLEVVCGWPFSADYLALVPAATGSPQPDRPSNASARARAPTGLPSREAQVEVIVPVYGGLDVLRRCLASVLDARCSTPWHLTVIDDASPDPAVGRWLREFAHLHPEVTVVTNARNLGFVATVNLGFRLAGRRDVVLLNSDTEVAGNWLDRLRHAAESSPRVGTVTPFSNNATICSYPRFCEDNTLPPGHTTGSLDRLFARAHPGATVEIPTAVGFCMYIRRDCLDEVGDFDATTFGAGYGEENDFCMRATARGWRHLHALDVFVLHAGGVSFSERRQALQTRALAAIRRLHPQYEDIVREFVARDPARPYREALLRLQT